MVAIPVLAVVGALPFPIAPTLWDLRERAYRVAYKTFNIPGVTRTCWIWRYPGVTTSLIFAFHYFGVRLKQTFAADNSRDG